jgi:regulatory protein
MNVITAIETQKKRGARVSIFVDGEFVVGAHEEVAAALNLGVGQSFDSQRLALLVRAETLRRARESALRLINYRERTRSEIRKRLIGNDYPEDVVDEVIDQLARVGLLDDRKFSRDWVESRERSKPMGRARLAWELQSKGVDKAMVEEALAGVDEDAEYQLAHSLAAHKLEKADSGDPAVRGRVSSMLARRGFNWEVIGKVMDDLYKG